MSLSSPALKNSRIVNHSPVFYGWIIWIVATVGFIASMPGQSATISLFIDHFIEDFGMDRTTVSLLYSVGTFIASLSLIYVGRMIDRLGNRRMSIIVSLLFVVALGFMSLVVGPLMLLLGFIMIRALGQGSMFLVSSTALANWFRSWRGRVMSMGLFCFALFQSFYVPQLQHLIETMGWRQVWLLLAAGILVIVTPLMFLLMRDRPEEYGLKPDGFAKTKRKNEEVAADDEDTEENWTLGEAMRTSLFWVFAIARMITPAWGTGLILHQVSLFGTMGFDAATAAQTYAIITMIMAIAVIFGGYLVDHLRPAWIITLQLSVFALAMGVATIMNDSFIVMLYALSFGIGMGVGQVFDGAVWPNLFGRLHQGAIRGVVSTMTIVGAALGPIVFGLSYDLTGSYTPALWVGIVLCFLGIIAANIVRLPKRKIAPTPEIS